MISSEFSSNEKIISNYSTGEAVSVKYFDLGEHFNELPDNVPQQYEVCVKDPNDWEDIHNYIINENELDGIPNRRIDCISDMSCSSKRSVYQMSNEEADILRNHPKVQFVEKSSLYNPVNLEKAKFFEKIDPSIDTNRFKEDITNIKYGDPGTTLDHTQWGLLRHSNSSNSYSSGTASVDEDIQYSLSGKNVDVVIMDTGVRWDHPDFLKQGVSTFVDKNSTRVRDILIHGESEYGINWSSHGLVAPGTGTFSNYTIANALESSSFNGSWHGTHVAGIAAGNQFGWAYEANIWSIACLTRSDLGWSSTADGFDYIRVWHKNKPINPETGRRNPTILNGSWSTRQYVIIDDTTNNIGYNFSASFRGTTYTRTQILSASNVLPAVYYTEIDTLDINGISLDCYKFVGYHTVNQIKVDELFDDSDCDDLICVFSAGNQGNKMDTIGGDDYDNTFISATIISSSYSNIELYYNRPGTPHAAHLGLDDAPIIVGGLDSGVDSNLGEYRNSVSNTGPAVDILSAGESILSPWSSGYQDPRNSSYYNSYLTGTSMATPQVVGVLACYAESYPEMTRVDARKWILNRASVTLPTDTGLFFDFYKDPVGVGSVSYWSSLFNLKGGEARILYDPTANNIKPKFRGVGADGISFKQI